MSAVTRVIINWPSVSLDRHELGIYDADGVNDILQGFDPVLLIFCPGNFKIFFDPFE